MEQENRQVVVAQLFRHALPKEYICVQYSEKFDYAEPSQFSESPQAPL